jgi:hypothetical protein
MTGRSSVGAGRISAPPLLTSGPPHRARSGRTSEVLDDAQAAEHHREAARQERDGDDERHQADDER